MKKHKINPPVKLAILCITIIIALLLIIRYSRKALINLGYFKISSITFNKPHRALDFSYLLGRSMFDIDLKKESRYISALYPVYKNIKLFRILPNSLFIGFTDRNPIACLKLYRYFYVDRDMVLFDLPQGQQAADLPVITGLERRIPGPKPGEQCNIKELSIALNIIKEIEANTPLKKYKIQRIDMGNAANISCFIQLSNYPKEQAVTDLKLLEVKMGQDNIADKSRVLAGLFNQFGDDINNIKYIDLRFNEAVVKFNEGKS